MTQDSTTSEHNPSKMFLCKELHKTNSNKKYKKMLAAALDWNGCRVISLSMSYDVTI